MRKAINTRPITIYLSESDFTRVKQITDDDEISMAQWFREAMALKLEQDDAAKEGSNEQ